MIRINLLPQAKRAARSSGGGSESSRFWLIGYAAAALLLAIVLAVVHSSRASHLDEVKSANARTEQEIERRRRDSSRLEEVQGQLEASRRLEQVVGELNRARTGPTRAIMELGKILSQGDTAGPTVDPLALEELRRVNPLAGFNRNWDPRRLWITRFEETNHDCKISGLGRTNEDVAEFLRRLSLSELFQNVTLQRSQSVNQDDTELVGFELTCQVQY